MAEKPVRVLLADDHALMRSGFAMVLHAAGIEVAGEATTGAEAIARTRELDPDVVCMDVQMPDMDGLEATRRIVASGSRAAILIVTTFNREDYLFEALAAGASGFLLKNAGPEELVSAVRIVAAGDALLAPEVTRRVIERFTRPVPPQQPGAPAARAVPGGGGEGDGPRLHEPFTPREAEVLDLLADARSNTEIAEALVIGEATVKTHVSRILQKLGARDRVQAVVYASRLGLTGG